jgi:ribosomal protein L10
MINPKPNGLSTSVEGKKKILARLSNLIQNTSMIISFPGQGITSDQITKLRNVLPTESTVSVIKNTLMKLAVNKTQFESITPSIKDQNMYIFIPEGDYRITSYRAYSSWLQDCSRAKKYPPRYAIFEGQTFLGENITTVSKLPSRSHMLHQIFSSIPRKLIQMIKNIENIKSAAVLPLVSNSNAEDATSTSAATNTSDLSANLGL